MESLATYSSRDIDAYREITFDGAIGYISINVHVSNKYYSYLFNEIWYIHRMCIASKVYQQYSDYDNSRVCMPVKSIMYVVIAY